MIVKNNELNDLKAIFLSLDTNHDGFISCEELEVGLSKTVGSFNMAHNDFWKELFHSLDGNDDGKIEYSEFITGAINKNMVVQKEYLDMAFKLIDQDGNQKITHEELKAIFSQGIGDDAENDAILTEFDIDHDGIISYDEFYIKMSNLIKN